MALGDQGDDWDCDGVLTADDCDDDSIALGDQADDGDCDAYSTYDDCDDGDATLAAKAEAGEEPDAVSGPTPNGSFDPADYILPADAENSTPYKLLIEINQADDDQASLVYAVEIDNLDPSTYQLLELVGYPKREDEDGKEAWSLFYVDESVGLALELIDSALLVIDRR